LVTEEVIRKAYENKTQRKIPRVRDPSVCNHDEWLKNSSLHAAHFLAEIVEAIATNKIIIDKEQIKVDVHNPEQLISIISKILDKDNLFDKYKEINEKQIRCFYKNSKYSVPIDMDEWLLDNENSYKEAKKCIRFIEQPWLSSLNPQKFDRELLDISERVERFSPHKLNLKK